MPTSGFTPPSPGVWGSRAGKNLDAGVNGPGYVTIFGHSYFDPAQGSNSNGQSPAYLNIDQSLLRQTLSTLQLNEAKAANYATSAATLIQDNTQTNVGGLGGHVTVLQAYSPQNIRQGASPGGRSPWTANLGLVIFMYGINDINLYANSNQAGLYRKNFYEAWRTVLSRVRSAAVYESLTDTQTTFSGGGLGGANWSIVSSNTTCSGTGFARTATVGATATIAVPSDYDGGTIALGFIGRKGATGGQATITVDGARVATVNTSNVTADTSNLIAGVALVITKRLTGLTPGAHTIVVTTTGIDGNFDYNYYQYEATEPNPIIICNINKLRVYSGSVNGDPLVDDWNQVIYDMQNEFGEPLEIADFDDAINQSFGTSAYNNHRISWDNLHLSELGSRYGAAAILDAYLRVNQSSVGLVQTTTPQRDTLGYGYYVPLLQPVAGNVIAPQNLLGSTAVTTTPVVNRLTCYPVVISRSCILSALTFQSITAVAGGGTFNAGLYYDRTNAGQVSGLPLGPQIKLFDWGTLTATVATPKNFALPSTQTRILTPGLYWLVIQPAAGVTLTCNSMSGNNPYCTQSFLTGIVNVAGYEIQRTATYTSLPATINPGDAGSLNLPLSLVPWTTLTVSSVF